MRRIRTVLALGIAAGLLAPDARAQRQHSADTSAFRITIQPSSVDTGFALQLILELPPRSDSIISLRLPDGWAGKSNLYRDVVGLELLTPGAELLPRTDSARIRVRVRNRAPLSVRWKLLATPRSHESRSGHNQSDISPEFAQLVGYSAFITPDIARTAPVRATIVVRGIAPGAPFATSFGRGDSVITARATRGDLQHAVYTFGIRDGSVRAIPLDVGGGVLTILVRGRLSIPDSSLSSAVQRVVAAERAFWRGKNPAHYLVTIGVASRGSLAGTRLTSAFVANIDSTRGLDEGVIQLFGHELMHDWLGNVLHPSSTLEPGSLSWFTEGFADYLSRRILWRAGLLTDSAYVAAINRTLAENAMSSARSAPWREVVEKYWTDHASQRQPYMRGELLALALDHAGRSRHPSRTVENFLLEMSRSGRHLTEGFTGQGLVNLFRRRLGAGTDAAVDSLLKGTRTMLPATMFGSCAIATVEERGYWDPGFDVDASVRTRTISGVRHDGPAWRAGVRDSMTIIRTSIWRGDATKTIVMGLRGTEGERHFEFLPATDAKVRVQQFRLTRTPCNRK